MSIPRREAIALPLAAAAAAGPLEAVEARTARIGDLRLRPAPHRVPTLAAVFGRRAAQS